MMHISNLDDGLELFKALGSEVRIQILKLLLEHKQMSMNQMASRLNITSGALTAHIKKMESCGLIAISNESAAHGNQKITGISISCELSSEAPGVNNDWPSDISFCLNGIPVGTWTSPGDFGDSKGMLTPDWWPMNWNQYGLLKLLTVNSKGTYIDGLKISDVTIADLKLRAGDAIRFRISVLDSAKNVGGLTIFGKTFGNYSQDIRISLNYAPIE